MEAFDCYGAEDPNYVGFDASDFLKGAGGLLSGLSGDDKSKSSTKQADEARARAEQSAATMKTALFGVIGAGVVGIIVFLAMRKPPAVR